MKRFLLFLSLYFSTIFSLNAQPISGNLCSCNTVPNECLNPVISRNHSIVMPYDGKIVFDGFSNLKVLNSNGLNPDVGMHGSVTYTNSEGDQKYMNVLINLSLKTETIPLKAGVTVDLTVSLDVAGNCVFEGSYDIPYTIVPLSYSNDPEPNDNADQALNTVEDTWYEGHGSFRPLDYTAHDDSVDWYKLTVPRDGILTIDVNSDTTTEDYYYTVLGVTSSIDGITTSNGNRVWGSTTSNPPNGVEAGQIYCVKAGDVLFVRVTGDANSYRFKWSVESPIGFIDVEPNDDFTEAIHLSFDDTKTGNIGYGLIPAGYKNQFPNAVEDFEDWYKFEITEPGDLQINIDTSEDLFNYTSNTLYKEDANGDIGNPVPLSGDQNNGFEVSCLSPGAYYVKLQTDPNNLTLYNNGCESCCVNYSLTVSHLNPPTYTNDTKINNSFNDAVLVTEGATEEGQLGYRYYDVPGYDNYDYYEFMVDNNGPLAVIFSEPFTGNATLHLGNQNKNQAGEIHTDANNDITSITFDCAKQGENYFLSLNSTTCLSYQFTYTNIANGINNETEPNDRRHLAQTFNPNDIISGHVGHGYVNNWDTFDYYQIPVVTSAPLEINLEVNGDVTAYIYEYFSQVTSVVQDENSEPITSISYNNTDSTKQYYLMLYSVNGTNIGNNNDCVNYTLNGWTQGFAKKHDEEPNNNVADAIAVSFNQTYTGRLSFYDTVSDSRDFYSFSLSEKDDVEFILDTFEGLSGTAILSVYNVENDNLVYQLNHQNGSSTSKSLDMVTLDSGDYYLTISGADETGSYAFSVIPQMSLSVEHNPTTNQIEILPNPTPGLIHINLNSYTRAPVQIFDMQGRKVLNTILEGKNTNLDLDWLSSGIYMLQIRIENYLITKRIIKE
ncbi:T9SS type A sorting domain-containing protein [Algibacter sp. 2305UL17-15]|uniref:T9SS type A sorting domain-containing protein n=1 Tax=Algibacter sp. 2305UL17-15 TaxID=3231268 RepID=UPI00345937AA